MAFNYVFICLSFTRSFADVKGNDWSQRMNYILSQLPVSSAPYFWMIPAHPDFSKYLLLLTLHLLTNWSRRYTSSITVPSLLPWSVFLRKLKSYADQWDESKRRPKSDTVSSYLSRIAFQSESSMTGWKRTVKNIRNCMGLTYKSLLSRY